LQNYSRERRNDILRAAKEFGGSIRQLVRLTGISFGIIRKA
jgi:transposase-like protein